MERILNWGLLSTAKINRALIKPLNASKRTRLLAVASRNISSAEAYAREWKIPRAHGSYEALLNDPEIDVIYNSPEREKLDWPGRTSFHCPESLHVTSNISLLIVSSAFVWQVIVTGVAPSLATCNFRSFEFTVPVVAIAYSFTVFVFVCSVID